MKFARSLRGDSSTNFRISDANCPSSPELRAFAYPLPSVVSENPSPSAWARTPRETRNREFAFSVFRFRPVVFDKSSAVTRRLSAPARKYPLIIRSNFAYDMLNGNGHFSSDTFESIFFATAISCLTACMESILPYSVNINYFDEFTVQGSLGPRNQSLRSYQSPDRALNRSTYRIWVALLTYEKTLLIVVRFERNASSALSRSIFHGFRDSVLLQCSAAILNTLP